MKLLLLCPCSFLDWAVVYTESFCCYCCCCSGSGSGASRGARRELDTARNYMPAAVMDTWKTVRRLNSVGADPTTVEVGLSTHNIARCLALFDNASCCHQLLSKGRSRKQYHVTTIPPFLLRR